MRESSQFSKFGKAFIAVISFVLILGPVGTVMANGEKDKSHSSGLSMPTQYDIEWMNKNLIKTKRVKFNKLGLERINKSRKSKGIHEISVQASDLGQEVVGSEEIEPSSQQSTEPVNNVSAPDYVDNSTLPYFPPIRNQAPLGSCATFSTVYYQMTYMTALARGWNVKDDFDNSNKFSPKWVYNMIDNGNNSGAWITNAFYVMLKNGCATWEELPYDEDYNSWPTNAVLWRDAINYRMDKSGVVQNVDTPEGLNNLKKLLNNGYVLTFGTYAGSWQYLSIKDDPATTSDDAFAGKQACYMVNGKTGNHAMTIVGYNDNIWVDINGNNAVDTGEKGALRVANSWGSKWQDGGFVWLSYDALKQISGLKDGPNDNREGCLWYNQAYWITARKDYSPLLTAEFTINHPKRNQLGISLGYSLPDQTEPSAIWSSYALNRLGGTYPLNGTNASKDGTFVVDFTDLITKYGLRNKNTYRWYLSVSDSVYDDSAATLKEFVINDITTGGFIPSLNNFPVQANGNTQQVWVDYSLGYTVSEETTPGPSTSPATPSPGPTPTVISTGNGDLNNDGKINSIDGSILKRIVLGTYTGSYDSKNGDLNGDGKINSTDYSLLKRRILNAS
ncbi:MAG TPA: dockerin type I domain-containing protein [Clostridia bacterium]